MNYREEVYLILNKINSKGGYSTDTINKNASSDFVRQAVYGVLENQILIDYMINKISKVKVRKMAPPFWSFPPHSTTNPHFYVEIILLSPRKSCFLLPLFREHLF